MRHMNRGTCSRAIDFEVEDNIVKSCQFIGGCHGNTQGIASLVVGMSVDEVIERLQGIDCNGRGTSCPAQLAEALKEYKVKNQ
ncbi:MAG: TIGR03905 family TSCPD domain-containing protein [Clostridiales bacterium]|nr:TIGR03905 family TSCPD domain-containing protein [Clostridiales bacterium]